jgi:hypothetical protein
VVPSRTDTDTGAPFKILVASMIGVVTATVGGLLGFVGRRRIEPLPPT